MLMKDTRLRAFHSVAVHRSFTKAAGHLLLSQQAVSFQIRNLEDEIGRKLFHRDHNGVDLTDAGHLLFGFAEKIVHLYNEAEEQLAEHAGITKGTLRIAATNSLVKYGLPTAIGAFRRK